MAAPEPLPLSDDEPTYESAPCFQHVEFQTETLPDSPADTVGIGADQGGSGVDWGRIALDVISNVVFKWRTGASGVNISLTDAPGETGRGEQRMRQ